MKVGIIRRAPTVNKARADPWLSLRSDVDTQKKAEEVVSHCVLPKQHLKKHF